MEMGLNHHLRAKSENFRSAHNKSTIVLHAKWELQTLQSTFCLLTLKVMCSRPRSQEDIHHVRETIYNLQHHSRCESKGLNPSPTAKLIAPGNGV